MGALSAAAGAGIQFLQQSPLLSGAFLFRPPTGGGGGGGGGGVLSIAATRTQTYFPQRRLRLLFFEVKSGVKSVESSSSVDELHDFRVVPSNVLMAEKEEAKAVLTMFLKKEIGLSNEATVATISKSVPFIDHLVARLYSIQKIRKLVGRRLTTLEIRDALMPYLEHLCEEHADSLDDIMESFPNLPEKESKDHRDSLDDVVGKFNFPNPPEEERENHISQVSPTNFPLDFKKLEAMAQVAKIGLDGQLPPNTLYLLDIGLDMDQIKEMARKYPSITCPSWGRNLKPLVECFLDFGVLPSDIPNILYKTPKLCNLSLSENIIPSMAYIETLGLDKIKWVKVIKRFPKLFTYSKQKVKAVVDYLHELGLRRNRIGKCLERCPQIVGLSVDDNLRHTAEYFQSIGVNLTSLLNNSPHIFCLSVECNLKPVTEFFLDKGFSIDEIGTMASRYGNMYTLSLAKNLIPKWDFFLTMDYPRSELVKCPYYFGYSLERRIKPRYAEMREHGVKLSLSTCFNGTDYEFLKIMTRRMKKMLDAEHHSMTVTSDNNSKYDTILYQTSMKYCKLKPVMEFFLDKGFGIDYIGMMVSRFGSVYSFSLTKNLFPKWNFFLTMDSLRSELVNCPTYLHMLSCRTFHVETNGALVILDLVWRGELNQGMHK